MSFPLFSSLIQGPGFYLSKYFLLRCFSTHKVFFLAYLHMGHNHDIFLLLPDFPVDCHFLANLLVHAADKERLKLGDGPLGDLGI